MTKIIKVKPIFLNSCQRCPHKHMVLQGFWGKEHYFCTAIYSSIKDTENHYGSKYPILKRITNKEDTYAYLENPDVIPDFCPLDDYKEENK